MPHQASVTQGIIGIRFQMITCSENMIFFYRKLYRRNILIKSLQNMSTNLFPICFYQTFKKKNGRDKINLLDVLEAICHYNPFDIYIKC